MSLNAHAYSFGGGGGDGGGWGASFGGGGGGGGYSYGGYYDNGYSQQGRYRERGVGRRAYRYTDFNASFSRASAPSQGPANANGTVVVDPNNLYWAAYDSSGSLVNSGRASAGRRYCPDIHPLPLTHWPFPCLFQGWSRLHFQEIPHWGRWSSHALLHVLPWGLCAARFL